MHQARWLAIAGPAAALLLCGTSVRAQTPQTKVPSIVKSPRDFCSDSTVSDASADSYDRLNPRYFMEVVEVSAGGLERPVFTSRKAKSGGRVVCERVNAPVDRGSKIVIRVNRDALENAEVEGKIGISARLEGSSGARAVEVPGYSENGKAAEQGFLSVMSNAAPLELARELNGWSNVGKKLDSLERAHGQRVASITQILDKTNVAISVLDDSLRELRSRRDAVEDVAQRNALIASATAAERTLERQNATRAELEAQRAQAERTYYSKVQGALRSGRAMRLLLRRLSEPGGAGLLHALAHGAGRSGVVVASMAAAADTDWAKLLELDIQKATPDQRADFLSHLESLETAMQSLNFPTDTSVNYGRYAGENVKDAEITLLQAGAALDDILSVTVTDTAGVPAGSRSMTVRMRVTEFGFVRRITDAVLFTSMPDDPDAAGSIAAQQALSNSTSVAGAVDVPVRMRGNPTAGVSLAWVYVPRVDDPYAQAKPWVRSIFNWLRPGVGTTALAASRPMKRVVITPNKPTTEQTTDSQIIYTLGVSVSILDGALVYSRGRSINGARALDYHGIGISFLQATEKARELFKGFTP